MKPLIALLDDSRTFLWSWRRMFCVHCELRTFDSPSLFWKALDDEPELLSQLSLVVTDLCFDNPLETGVVFAKSLRQRAPVLPVVLTSTGTLWGDTQTGLFDAVIEKSEMSWAKLESLLLAK